MTSHVPYDTSVDMKTLTFFSIAILAFSPSTVTLAETTLPRLKNGAWEVKTEIPQLKTPMSLTHCVTDETQEKLLKLSSEGHGSCDKAVITQSGKTWTSTANCNYQGVSSKIIATFTMDSETHYTSVVRTDNPKMASTITSTGDFKGDCASNNAQELKLGNGLKLDPKQLQAIAKQIQQSSH